MYSYTWPLYGTEQHGFLTTANPNKLLCFAISVNILWLLVSLIFGQHLIDSLLNIQPLSISTVVFFLAITFFIVSSMTNTDVFNCPHFSFWPLCILLKHAFAIHSTFINFCLWEWKEFIFFIVANDPGMCSLISPNPGFWLCQLLALCVCVQ